MGPWWVGRRSYRELGVLLADGADHVVRGEFELGQSIWPQPDAHGVVGAAEQGGVADPGNPLELVDDVEQGVVRQVGGIEGAIRRLQGDHLQDRGRFLLDRYPCFFTSSGSWAMAVETRLLTLMVA